MNRKILFSLMVCGFVCVSLVSVSLAQTVPSAPVTNTTVSTEKSDQTGGTIKPKKHHHHKKTAGTKKKSAKKGHKSETEQQTSTTENQVK